MFETVSSDIITSALDGYNGKTYCSGVSYMMFLNISIDIVIKDKFRFYFNHRHVDLPLYLCKKSG